MACRHITGLKALISHYIYSPKLIREKFHNKAKVADDIVNNYVSERYTHMKNNIVAKNFITLSDELLIPLTAEQ